MGRRWIRSAAFINHLTLYTLYHNSLGSVVKGLIEQLEIKITSGDRPLSQSLMRGGSSNDRIMRCFPNGSEEP